MADGLVAALARCQARFPAIVKGQTAKVPTKTGGQYEYSYADLAVIFAAVRPVLADVGIAVTQSTFLDKETGGVELVTTLMYGDDTISSIFPLHIAGLNAQGVGSLMTYHRRYQLCAILGVHPEGEDDDGSAAQVLTTNAASSKPVVNGDPYALAAATRPEKPLAAMTAGEMARYGESIGIRVSGNKSDILRQLEPYVKAAEGTEPFGLDGERVPPKPDLHDKPFEPVVAGDIRDRQAE